MTLLSFHQAMTDLLRDVASTGGDPHQLAQPSAALMADLRKAAMEEFTDRRRFEFFLAEDVSAGGLREAVAACLAYLRGLGVADSEEQRRILSLVVRAYAKDQGYWHRTSDVDDPGGWGSGHRMSPDLRDRVLVQQLLEIWSDSTAHEVLLYSMARRRFLIAWDELRGTWRLTNVGQLALRLPPVQLASCIILSDLILAGNDDVHHVSTTTLEMLLSEPTIGDFHRLPQLPHLELMGIIRRTGVDREVGHLYDLSPIGRTVLSEVLDGEHPLRRTVQAMLESEERGESFVGRADHAGELVELLDALGESDLSRSCSSAVLLLSQRSYVDAARVLFPLVESLASRMLKVLGIDPSDQRIFRGLSAKVLRLEREGAIPADLANALNIVSARNAVLHGEFSPRDQEYGYPLCVAALAYLRRLAWEARRQRLAGIDGPSTLRREDPA